VPQSLVTILIALITGGITLTGSFLAFKGDMTSARYERMEKLEADVTRLTAENVALQVEQALISAHMDYRPTDLTGIRLWVAERMEISAALMTGAIEIDEAEEEWRTADEKLAQFLADTLTERAI
jgi:uncharacterized iron-regulated membrane protein